MTWRGWLGCFAWATAVGLAPIFILAAHLERIAP